jgi:hypothetical protein
LTRHDELGRENTDKDPLGARIGWLADSAIYLDPEAAFTTAQRLAHEQGHGSEITQRTLWKRMKDRGLLLLQASSEKEGRLLVKERVGGKMEWVVALPRTALEVVDDQCSQCFQSDGEQQDPPVGPDTNGRCSGDPCTHIENRVSSCTYREHWEQRRKLKRGAGFEGSA